jgi:hypothetical protein
MGGIFMKKFTFAVLIVLLMVVCSSPGRAAFPQQLNYQGKLANASGVPLSGNYSVVFAIYNAASGGGNLWSETQVITAESGLFNVILGSVTPIGLDVFDGNDRWLGVAVGADPEMSPRHKLVSVGNAFKASDSDKLGGQLPSYYLGGGVSGGVSLGPLTQQTTTVATAIWVKGATTGISGEGSTYGVYGLWDANHYGFLGNSFYGAYGSADVGVNGKYNGATARFGQLGTSMYAVFGQYDADYPYGGIGASDKGVVGYSGTNGTYGVYGQYDSSNYGALGRSGTGVYGKGTYGVSGEGSTCGVFGTDGTRYGYIGSSDHGVYGRNGTNYGFLGGEIYGVYGNGTVGIWGSNAGDGNKAGYLGGSDFGAYGQSSSSKYGGLGSTNYGAFGTHNGTILGYLGSANYGAYGAYDSNRHGYLGSVTYGAYGQYDSDRYGYMGSAIYGAYGQVSSGQFGYLGGGINGVYGESDMGAGVSGKSTLGGGSGGYFTSSGSGGYGAYAENSSTTGTSYGLYAKVKSVSACYALLATNEGNGLWGYIGGPSYGVYGIGSTTGNRWGYIGGSTRAVYGQYAPFGTGGYPTGYLASSTTGVYGASGENGDYGGYFHSDSTTGRAVFANNTAATGTTFGVYGEVISASGYAGYFSGKLRTTDAGGTNHVYDIAELIPCAPEVGPADVVIINPRVDRQAIKCSKESDHRAIGIISENPQLSIGDQQKANAANPGKNFNFIALAGQVPCKVSTKNGPIYPGDLLTTSDIPGHAVKATKPGTIVAKALETFDGSKGDAGLILVFVNVSWFGGTQ